MISGVGYQVWIGYQVIQLVTIGYQVILMVIRGYQVIMLDISGNDGLVIKFGLVIKLFSWLPMVIKGVDC